MSAWLAWESPEAGLTDKRGGLHPFPTQPPPPLYQLQVHAYVQRNMNHTQCQRYDHKEQMLTGIIVVRIVQEVDSFRDDECA